MAIKKRMRDGTIKYITYNHEEDNQKVAVSATLMEDKDKEIARLTALVQTLTKEIEKLSKPKEELGASDDVEAVAAVRHTSVTADSYYHNPAASSLPLP
jgi:hypothetical protein